jgi:phosphomevalonate kinase
MEVLAPGKLFVMGEYAVLNGGDAIVAAVDHGVRCCIQSGSGISTPDGDTRFAEAALKQAQAPSRHYEFSVWNPLSIGHKVGLGGSAAAVVAAFGAARLAQGERMNEADLAPAKAAHFQVQGSGSGRDVMASYYGGLSRFCGEDRRGLAPIPLTVIHSGQAARTGPRVQAYQALGAQPAFLQEAAVLVDAFENEPVEALLAYGQLLHVLSQRTDFCYLTDAHAEIIALSRHYGGGAKPSGAGGGDIAVALIPDKSARTAFVAACASKGLVEVPVGLAPGLHVENTHV